MGLLKYIGRKVVYTFLLLLLVVAFNFLLFQILPFIVSCPTISYNDCVTRLYLPEQPPRGITNVTEWQTHLRARLYHAYGFDQSIPVRFVDYVKNMFSFNFGYNIGSALQLAGPVWTSIQQRAPYTIILLGSSTVASFVFGIGLGVVASAKRGKVLDVSSLAALLFVNALPVFFLGGILELFELGITGKAYQSVGALTYGQFSWAAWAGLLQALFLPFLTLTLVGLGGVFLTQRAVMIDTLGEDYVIMARAKGVRERTVLFKHALRNAVLPIVTAFALSIGFILSGAIITETVFQWPGLGKAIYSAISSQDFPFTQAMFFIITLMVLVSLFAADIAYGFLDPRVSRD